ncbi:MAG: ImmA/IrrE family metallo-endopeptidase [Myxococcales bacterium]|nr:ImmA/IrrE family metallo-endopeptidase [Myxococcales bacterium]
MSEKLFDFGIDVYPADDHELTTLGNEGYTQYEDGRVVVVLKERQWTALTDHGFALHRARTTVGHELGHAVLHRDVLEQMAAVKVANPAAALHRVRRRDIKPYCDPEWQAWAFCGGILLPREALRKLHGHSLEDISREFQVSLPMIRSHLRKLGRFGFQVQGGLLVAA